MIWFFQRAIWPLGRGLFELFLHFRVEGAENLPDPKKQCLIISNHRSYPDSFLVPGALPFGYYLKARTLRFMALEYYCRVYILGWFILPLGAYPISQKINNTNHSLEKTFELIKKGQNILIFPEGGIARDGIPKEAKRGIAHLARETNLPILPVAVKGSLDISFFSFFSRKQYVTVKFGQPFYYFDLIKTSMDDKEAAQVIMGEVNRML